MFFIETKLFFLTLLKFVKWHPPSRNSHVGDIVCLRSEPLVPTRWPLARVIEVHPGQDGKTRVVTIRTATGIYKQSIVKMCGVPVLTIS